MSSPLFLLRLRVSAVLLFTTLLLTTLACDDNGENGDDEAPDAVEQPDEPAAEIPDADTFALDVGLLIDGTGGELIRGARIVVDGDRINAVGRAAAVDVPDGAPLVDLSDATVIPGLIDSHVHLGPLVVGHDEEGLRGTEDDQPPEGDPTDEIVDLSRGFVEHGVTTVKSVGDPFPWVVEARDAMNEAMPEAPRTYVAGPLITAPDGHPTSTIYADNPWLAEHATVGPEDEKAAVDQIERFADAEVDLVKFVYDDGGDRFERIENDIFDAAIDAADEHDLPAAVHIGSPPEAQYAVDAGAAGIEHARPMGDRVMKSMLRDGVFFVPTLTVYDAVWDGVPDEFSRTVGRASELNVDLVAGSDVGNPGIRPGAGLHREMSLMVEAGLSPMKAIVAATSTAADYLGATGELGVIEGGARADLVVLGENPLDDIAHTTTVEAVVVGGEVVALE